MVHPSSYPVPPGGADPSAPSNPPPAGRSRKRHWPLLIAGVLVVLVATFAGGAVAGWKAHAAWWKVPEPTSEPRPQIAAPTFPSAVAGPEVQKIVLPDVRGLSPDDAKQALADAGFDPAQVTVKQEPSVRPAGSVLAQDPLAGTEGPGPVVLTVSTAATVPDLRGAPEADGRRALEDLGVYVSIERKYDAGATPGTVLSLTPAVGETATEEMTMVIAAEPASVYLAEVKAVSGRCRAANSAQISGDAFPSAVSCPLDAERADENAWLLNRKVAGISGVVGIDDTATPGVDVRLVITGDGTTLFDKTLTYGKAEPLDIKTAGMLRLTIHVTAADPNADAQKVPAAVLGDLRLTGSQDDLASLDQR